MQKIGDSTSTANGSGEFTHGQPGSGVDATQIMPAWLNAIQRELVNVVLGADLTLDPADDSQVLKAIQAIQTAANNWAKLAGKPTTVSGFGITDAYTKSQIDASKAPLASPDLTGIPKVPTAALGTNTTQAANTAFVKAAIDAVINAAPGALDTLKELADALGNDPNFATSITNLLGGKADKATTLDGYGITDAARVSDLPLSGGISGMASNLKLSATGLSAAVSVSFDELAVSDALGKYRTLKGGALTLNMSTVGANALDTGVVSASTWYSVWVIRSASTVAALASLSATAPALPAGYTHKARVGWARTDATVNKYPLSFTQQGRSVQYKVAVGSNVASIPVLSSGVAGNINTPAWVAVPTGAFVPPTAASIKVIGNTAQAGLMVAPNNQFGAIGSTTNPPPYLAFAGSSNAQSSSPGVLLLESSNIYLASSGSSSVIACLGWEDNL